MAVSFMKLSTYLSHSAIQLSVPSTICLFVPLSGASQFVSLVSGFIKLSDGGLLYEFIPFFPKWL